MSSEYLPSMDVVSTHEIVHEEDDDDEEGKFNPIKVSLIYLFTLSLTQVMTMVMTMILE